MCLQKSAPRLLAIFSERKDNVSENVCRLYFRKRLPVFVTKNFSKCYDVLKKVVSCGCAASRVNRMADSLFRNQNLIEMEKNVKVYEHIKNVAQLLVKDNVTMTRSDLAYELEPDGVKGDSLRVGELVVEAADYYGGDVAEIIKKSFYNNERSKSLYDECKVWALIEQKNSAAVTQVVRQGVQEGGKALERVGKEIEKTLSPQLQSSVANLVNTLSGNGGVEVIKGQASSLFDQYTLLVDSYKVAKGEVKNTTVLFSELREYVMEIYRKYATMLIDVYGDRVKEISPEIFDFESVQYLNVQGMFESVELQYNALTEQCSQLLCEIRERFVESAKRSALQFSEAKDKRVGVLLAGLNMVSHYLDAAEKTGRLKRELVAFSGHIRKDAATINSDMARLSQIFKTINDVFIPKAELFYEYAPKTLSDEMDKLTAELYSDESVAELKNRRDALLAELKGLERNLLDEQLNIEYYKQHLKEGGQMLGDLKDEYEKAKSCKPSEPFFLTNIVTLGNSKKNYNRDLYEWKRLHHPVVVQYEELQVDLHIDGQELEKQQKLKEENSKRCEAIRRELKMLQTKMLESVKSNPEVQAKMLAHVNDIVKLLHLAKGIVSSKLDHKLVETAKLAEFTYEGVPEEVKNGVKSFLDEMRKNLSENEKGADLPVGQNGECTAVEKKGSEDAVVEAQCNSMIQKGITIFEQFLTLEELKEQERIEKNFYEQEVERVKVDFQTVMSELDAESDALVEIMKGVRTAKSKEQMKKSLLLLCDSDKNISENEWNDILNGVKKLEI